MKIKLNNNFYVRSDFKKSVALCETYMSKKRKNDEEYIREKVHGYFPNVALAVKTYLQLVLNESDKEYSDLKEYIVDLENLYEEVKHDFSKECKKIN
ncbi:hypothetical protein E4P35_13070 [Thiopseudomonas sp. 4R-3cl]|nr:hypothetical protein E4P35_13070 [Thiopseudomonas sp. 4R-3cl]